MNAPPPLAAAAVTRLWRQMRATYGHRWTAQYGIAPARGLSPVMATWARGLAGLSERELALGLARTVRAGDPWPPALPEFRARCRPRPEDFGLPPEAVALEEALRRHRRRSDRPWSHPAVAAAARAAFERPWGSLRERDAGFLRAYRHVAGRVLAGRAVSAPPPEALGPPPEPPESPGAARRHLAALRRIAAGGRGGAP